MEPIEIRGGWIYILSTSADYYRCKIGRTGGNPLARFRQLRTGDPYLAFAVAYHIPEALGAYITYETLLHKLFNNAGISNHDDGPTEWFEMSSKVAEEIIDLILQRHFDQDIYLCTSLQQELICKMYEEQLESCYNFNRDSLSDWLS